MPNCSFCDRPARFFIAETWKLLTLCTPCLMERKAQYPKAFIDSLIQLDERNTLVARWEALLNEVVQP